MKRDMDVVRDVLCAISDAEGKPSWKGLIEGKSPHEAEVILYHIDLLNRAGYLTGNALSMGGHKIWENLDLTWQGHEFVDAVRNPETWTKTKEGARKIGSWSVDLLLDMAKAYAKHLAKEKLGLDL
jgi:hypothetical protein